MRNKSLIIAHRDADGITSAIGFSCLSLEKEQSITKPTLKLIFKNFDILDIQYSDEFHELIEARKIKLSNYNKVIILDYTVPTQVMRELYDLFKENLIWIDHHKRTYQRVEAELSDIDIKGLREDSVSASVLVYQYFNKEPTSFARYISDMDLWKWELPSSRDFIAGVINFETRFKEEQYKYILNLINDTKFKSKFKIIVKRGIAIREYQKDYVKSIIGLGKVVMFEGYKAFIINTIFFPGLISDYIFEDKNYKDVDIIIVWKREYSTNKDYVSLRSKEINLTSIAGKYGGGGHPNACGIALKDIKELDIKEIN